MSAPVDYRRRGQAVWLDTISAKLVSSGRLSKLITSGAIYGVTSNPTIFGQSIKSNDGDYNEVIGRMASQGKTAFEIYDFLTQRDIGEGADLFVGSHASNPVDGWISLEVLPSLAPDADETVAEALRLVKALGRHNVFIKVPSTPAGLVALRRLTALGVSINVTLMFNRKHYHDVAMAYVNGLQDLAGKGGDISRVHSVASFFVSRVDTKIDPRLDALAAATEGAKKEHILALRGKAGLANCKVVYQDFLELFAAPSFTALRGANVQRPLWASTGTKNKAYSDLLYVENLIGADTVNTMPETTLLALLDHGKCPGNTVTEGVEAARKTLADLKELGIDVEAVGEELQVEGVASFEKSYVELLETIESRRENAAREFGKTQRIAPPASPA